uniref:SHSP domain-containing protein n=1 Tax=Chenopodium quinoa TaxID=63459 RepID=A0A803LDJ5_CHEQI
MALIEEMGGFGNLMNDQDLLTKVLNQFTKRDMNPGDRTTTPLADILSNPKEYVFYIDVPGLAKSDVQVQLEDENILVKMMRKFRLPQDADASTISAKCENGVLTVTVKKIPPSKPKTVQVAIS